MWTGPLLSRAGDPVVWESPLPVERLRRTCCLARGIWGKRPLVLGRSQRKSPSAGQHYKAEKVITPGENARMPSVPNTRLFRTTVLCAVNVGKHSGTNLHLSYTRDTILEKDIMSFVNAENPLGRALPSVNMERLTLGPGNTSAANVGSP